MTTLTHRDRTSLLNDLVTWVGTVAGEPEIRVEEYAEEDRHVIKADLPGLDPDHDIDVSVGGGVLRLRVQRREEEKEKTRTEIRYGTFERALSLPAGIRVEDVSAAYENGVLTVSFPVTATSASHRISVSRPELPAE